MKNFITKSNDTGGDDSGTATKWGANESNSVTEELKTAVEQAGLTLSTYTGAADPDTDMLAKSIVITAQTAHSYTDGGSANAYVLTKSGSLEQPDSYLSGMLITFNTSNPNTGASTVNISSIGVKAILNQYGMPLVGGEIRANVEITMRYNGTSFVLTTGNAGLLAQNNLLHIQDQKSSGTDGGTFTQGSYYTRDLNTIITNEIENAVLSLNQIILPPGTYDIEASAPGYTVANHRIRLYNVTDATDVILGTSEYNAAADNVQTRSYLKGRFTITATKTFEIQHRCSATRAGNGMGQASTYGSEIYTDVMIYKIG